MEKLNIKRFAPDPGSVVFSEDANIKINEDLKVGSSGISLSEFLTMKTFFDMFHFETKEFGGATWLKVYYTHSQNGTVVWKDIDELGFSLQAYKWSI